MAKDRGEDDSVSGGIVLACLVVSLSDLLRKKARSNRMEFHDLTRKALEVQDLYRDLNAREGHRHWTAAEYMQGFVGDVGDLAKLIMARNSFRHNSDIDSRLGHELADCLWSIIILASELDIDLEANFLATMEKLNRHIDADK
jgi:NTP pyrophosphatase (non-canonical NTP hydrolase)